MSISKKNYGGTKEETLLKGSVVLCTHGILADQNAFNSMFDFINGEYLYYNVYALKPIKPDTLYLTQNNIKTDTVKSAITGYINAHPNKNLMISVGFGEEFDAWGKIDEQVSFMSEIVNGVQDAINASEHKTHPIILLGHSKGGLVNMNCALNNSNVKKIISVGTPYEGTILDHLVSFALDVGAGMVSGGIYCITQAILDSINNNRKRLIYKMCQILINQSVVDINIASKWKNRSRYIPCTAIATDVVEFKAAHSTFSGDYVVPLSSANGSVLENIKSFTETEGKVTLDESFIRDAFSQNETFANMIHLLADILEDDTSLLFKTMQVFSLLFQALKEVLEDGGELIRNSMKLAHFDIVNQGYSQLNNTLVVIHIVGGINA